MKKKEGVLDEEILFQILSLMLVLSMVMGGAAIPARATDTMPPEETVLETSEPTEANSETFDLQETVPETGESEETVPETSEPEETEPVELPPVTTSDGHYVAWPSLLENFDFPDDWSTAALEFCVGNRIIEGRDDGLTANEYTTRAETAAILVRMLGAKADPSALSGYQDVNPQAWYYDEVSAAVAVGLMKGTSNTTINPNARLTREDACVLLSRAFGILPVDNHQYETFSDAASVSKYARSAVSGLIELGVVKGYTDNTFRPKANITRAELAKLVYEAVTHICDSVDQLPGNGRVLYRGTEDIPQGYQLSGSLILGYGYSGSGVVDGVKVTGRLALSCTPGTWIDLKDCTLSQLTVSSKINVTGDSKAVYLMIGEEGSVVDVEANQVRVFKDCTLEGAYGRIHVVADDLCVTLNGSADNVYLYCTYTTLQGAGYAEAVDIYEKNCDVTLDCGICTDHIYLAAYNSALSTVQTVDSWYNYQRQEPYSTATMEGFVDLMGYSSETQYLIWVSTTTTTVNVFTGSQGNWKLERSMACALGAPDSPTVKGIFKTYKQDDERDFGSYKCRWVTNFYSGYAFHSRKWSSDYSYLVDPSINCLVCAGCVRMYDEDCYFIYSTIPLGTAVVVC